MLLTVNVSITIPERSSWNSDVGCNQNSDCGPGGFCNTSAHYCSTYNPYYSLANDTAVVFKNDTGKISASGTSVTGTGTHFKEDFTVGSVH